MDVFVWAIYIGAGVSFLMWLYNDVVSRECPHCKKKIPNEASVCSYCGRDVPVESVNPFKKNIDG